MAKLSTTKPRTPRYPSSCTTPCCTASIRPTPKVPSRSSHKRRTPSSPPAKEFARHAHRSLAYGPDDFQVLDIRGTTIDLHQSDDPRMQHSEVEGVFTSGAEALMAAHYHLAALHENDDFFVRYEFRPPFSEVVVHAISITGENYYIAVKEPLEEKAHARHHTGIAPQGFAAGLGRTGSPVAQDKGGVSS
ncbi:hypothetical protein PG996_002994 [Apiospora saccharicola]|uniref:Uncharacterized protein n=1 Tax=Apiospora saccharicola TaxID=335842 RepID=A0ABR1VZZ8_9PEZI